MDTETLSRAHYPNEAIAPAHGSHAPLAALAPPERPDEIGRFEQYRVRELLYSSGASSVFHADDFLERPVALKLLSPEMASNPTAREWFFRGARLQAGLCDPHVPPVYSAGETNGVPYLVTRYLEGQTLRERTRSERLPLTETVRIALGVAEGLTAIHRANVIHRDIKPSNIILAREAATPAITGMIVDFGLACRADDPGRPGELAGTPLYMSPEQARGDRLDARTDLFSLGVLLYELVTGRRPFTGDSITALKRSIQEDSVPAPTVSVPDAPPPLNDLILRLLEKRPEDRPASSLELVRALAEVRRELADPVPKESAIPARTDEELAHELIELEKQFKLPERGEAIPDAEWFDEHWGKPALTQYRGSFVAILNGAVVGHGVNSLQLQIDLARKCNVHPQRFIIEYIPRPSL